MRKLLSVIVILALVYSISTPSFAASTWNQVGGGNWNAANWTGGIPNSNGSTANLTNGISSPATVALAGTSETVGTLNIGTSGESWTISSTGGVLNFNNSGADAYLSQVSGSASNSISAAITANDSTGLLYIQNASSNNLTLSGGISSGSGLQEIYNNGSGTGAVIISGNITDGSGTALVVENSSSSALTLSGTNTYTGGTNLLAGTLNINSTTALGATSGVFALYGGTINNTSGGSITNANNNAINLNGSFGFGTAGGTANNDLNLGTGAVSNGGNYTITLNGQDTLTFGGVMTNTSGAINTLTVTNGGGTNATTAVNFGGYALSNNATNYNDVINGSGNVNITGAVTNGSSSNSGLTYSGTGILTLSGVNTYTAGTTISSGTIEATTSASSLGTGSVTLSGGTLDLYNNSALAYDNNVSVTSSSTIKSDTVAAGAGVTHTLGTLGIASGDTLAVSLASTANSGTQGLTFGAVTLAGNATINANTGAGGAGGLLTLASVSGSGDTLTFEGSATTTISGASTIGTLQFGSATTVNLNGNLTGSVDFNNYAGILTVASGESISAGVANSTGASNKGTLNFLGSTTISGGNIGSSTANEGLAAVNFEGGTSTLDNNIYATTTTLSNAASLTTVGGQRTIAGAVTLSGTSTLNIGTTNLINSGVYTQGSGTTLDITANSASNYGYITSTGHTAVVNNGSTVNVIVGGYIPSGTTLDIINTGGTGVTGGSPTVNALYANSTVDPFISFSSSVVGNNDILTVNHISAGFSSLGSNPNAAAIGYVLDNETNPSSDLANILNTLESSSASQITAALNTFTISMDRGVMDSSTASLNTFTGASLEHAQSVLALASSSGVSAGDRSLLNSLWAKQYGGYIDQGTRDGIEGYNAWNEGTTVGVDHLFNENLTVGASLGYAYGEVNSDENSANTNISSFQGTLYGGYQGTSIPYYVELAGSVAENWYNGNRDITVDTTDTRIAQAQYRGTQTGIYFESGYKYDAGNNWQITPLTSLQWTHLNINSYDETNAGDLSLNVNSQSYDTLESGLGASIAYPVKYAWGSMTPEFHAKWLYDFINDNMSVTSAFAGGGASFTTNGAAPARNGANVGGKLTFDLKNDISVVGQIDTELKDQYFGITGSVSVRYKF